MVRQSLYPGSPSIGTTNYAPWLGRVSGWVSCLGLATGCVQDLGRALGWALL